WVFEESGIEAKEVMMPNRSENFMTLLKEGKIEEARALIETEKANSKYSPDTIVAVEGGSPQFTRKGKPVELGDNGKWRLKQ
ncbi:MAG: hypothetical protein WCC73_03760, partial [Terracidiphilus sp.]